MPFNLKNVSKDIGLALEKNAVDKFGAVVDDFTSNTIGKTFGNDAAATSTFDPTNRNDPRQWYSTSYAAALAGATSYRPKLKFLFKVEFIFTDKAKDFFRRVDGERNLNDFTFMIKSVDRPKIDFEYEDDVNMYNFRTKVLKRIRHQELTMVFMDDVGNKVFSMFRNLMMIHSPITRGQMSRDGTTTAPPQPSANKSNGMPFGLGGAGKNAHRAVVNTDFGNSIHAIRVKQIFVDPSPTGDSPIVTASKMTSFDFINPRIVRFDLDELTHESSDPSLVTMVFDYDWMEMVKVGSLGSREYPYEPDYKVFAPGVTGAPSDISPNTKNGATNSINRNNPLLADINGVLNRGVNQFTSDMVSGAVRSVAGNGRFATAIGGRLSESIVPAISGLANPLVGGSVSAVSGLVEAQARDISSGIGNAWSRARAPMITSQSTAGADSARAAVFSNPEAAKLNPIDARGGVE